MSPAHYLALGAVIFAIGAFGMFTRRNVVFIFMSLEIMFAGVGVTLVAFSRFLAPAVAGQVFVIFVLTVAAAETALGLAIFLALSRSHETVNADEVSELKG
ncbi:MAG: NADH-quinone oxidoreductase subunit NuoK [Clostridia bacterium]|nr:MAG: NADH-quinone oxidoreductase subunit NuoK [Clostridia bacterium]